MSSSKSDPRRVDQVIHFHIPVEIQPDQADNELFTVGAVLLSLLGFVMRNRWASWGSLFLALCGSINEKVLTSSNEKKPFWTTFMFAIVSLTIQYIPLLLEPQLMD
ncbi:hypothetical protein CONCODRAFT_15264 [Conidiobolus coronatus NRRL 28638]|uniref:Protein Asterix n=1 Tax=Conidiobolus coronatus (strain ATCC 28846 / CBS 209.66 / NRRL 28638) TaxID=796925 RepID=A0A137PFM7_CONC2|nr:hypothetical protein CONCODRAFT_15264 [Conidiobolus coronatus NRRL 28638]|eukprot:KXN73792.1 hypothetical protein CONCODRAFT_15264 [Conidiobolus coronatus NRRL 28638]